MHKHNKPVTPSHKAVMGCMCLLRGHKWHLPGRLPYAPHNSHIDPVTRHDIAAPPLHFMKITLCVSYVTVMLSSTENQKGAIAIDFVQQ